MNYINLDFCVIENPLDKNKRPIIFVTRKGKQYLDETIVNEDDYEKAIYTIQNIGYVESDILTFEFSQDPEFPTIALDEIKKILEDNGMRYSNELEETIKNEFELFNIDDAKKFVEKISNNYSTPKKNSYCYKKNFHRIPEIGERITLYFYLFIECKFSGEKCYINLNGDFTSWENNESRNFLFPFKCDFIRINSIYNPNKIILKSCLTNQDISKKLPMDFSGSFNLKIHEKDAFLDKLFVYYLMEIKNNFPLENRITIEIDSSNNFNQMIKMSKKTKGYYKKLFNSSYNIQKLKSDFEKINEILTPKMLLFAEQDEFEKAAKVKKDIKYIEDKLEKIKKDFNSQIEIPYCKFIKNFHLN